ncbi:MAG: pyridoxal kinase [Pseudomonadota bacterium]
MPVIIAIASQVARGHVGNGATVFALERMGFEVWPVPTVLLPYHPGHGPGTRIVTPSDAFGALLDDLARHPQLGEVVGVLSGYLGDAGQAPAIARLVGAVKAANPKALFVCDPVMGDDGSLYVNEALAASIRDHLVPLADTITPNRFELSWLMERDCGDNGALGGAAKDWIAGRAHRAVHVTSAFQLMRNHAGILAVTHGTTLLAEAPAVPQPPHGLGDLYAALQLAHTLKGLPLVDVLRKSAASVHDMALQTARLGRDEMPLAVEQHRLLQSSVVVQMRTLAQ